MASPDDDGDARARARAVNPPPERVAGAAFLLREVIAFLFVAAWLLLYGVSLVTGLYMLPFWFHCVSVSVLGYALGLNVADMTAARPPQEGGGGWLRRLRARREQDVSKE